MMESPLPIFGDWKGALNWLIYNSVTCNMLSLVYIIWVYHLFYAVFLKRKYMYVIAVENEWFDLSLIIIIELPFWISLKISNFLICSTRIQHDTCPLKIMHSVLTEKIYCTYRNYSFFFRYLHVLKMRFKVGVVLLILWYSWLPKKKYLTLKCSWYFDKNTLNT